jgi:hypothetical protein
MAHEDDVQEPTSEDQTAADDAALAGDDGPPPEAELGGAEFDEEEEEWVREAARERGESDDEDDDEDEEGEPDEADDEGTDEEELGTAAAATKQPERRPAPPDAVHADDDPDAVFSRELAELSASDGEEAPSSTNAAQPAGHYQLPLPPPGHTWAFTANGPIAIPLAGPQQPTGQPQQQPGEEYDPDAVLTVAEFERRSQVMTQQYQRQMQQLVDQQTRAARAQAMMDAHLDRFSLTRNKDARMRRAVRDAIAEELPNGWTDADFAKVSRRVTQQFYVERNQGRPKTNSAAKPKAAASAPQPKKPASAPRPAPRMRARQDDIDEEVGQIRQLLGKGKTRSRGR